ncbi:DUF2231 domain-containing protein [Desulfoluna spongiiphila]|uniref:DUF2231 domain-containing protein n=1 Tax=Desulfoluna spongiiphila TaxID=419481 RepID=A0A1G5H321_9BACT|nr:DUF2231 domain-containing protein [Desulfoluna spongiiphila]SCY57949.1 hypothetical protein SAMN05216233_11280 [Desulfoluna spongiiphila]VVS94745.1 hypothetical protein DBB_43170 [Desulfoluna spongiiphila]
MVEFIYGLLESVGFAHPLHPAATHIPMGLVMGALIFRMVAIFTSMKELSRTGYHCAVLGLLGTPPTVVLGWMDWQYRYGGEWEFLIGLKMVLALTLMVILILIVALDDPETPRLDLRSFLYVLGIANVIGLGFSGGELIYG